MDQLDCTRELAAVENSIDWAMWALVALAVSALLLQAWHMDWGLVELRLRATWRAARRAPGDSVRGTRRLVRDAWRAWWAPKPTDRGPF